MAHFDKALDLHVPIVKYSLAYAAVGVFNVSLNERLEDHQVLQNAGVWNGERRRSK